MILSIEQRRALQASASDVDRRMVRRLTDELLDAADLAENAAVVLQLVADNAQLAAELNIGPSWGSA